MKLTGGRRHLHQHAKKDDVVTIVDTVTDTAPEVIVYVDQNGVPYSTGTVAAATTAPATTAAAPAATTAAAAPVQEAEVKVASSASSTYVAPASPASSVVASSATSVASSSAPATSSSSSSSSSESSGFGLSYSPYNSDGSCKTQSQVTQDFSSISGYSLVRTYGTDCNQVSTVLTAAKAKGMKLFAGVFDLSTLSSEIATIVSAANGDWSSFDTISIGNELVNSGTASASTVVAAIGTARGLLKAAGYTGKVVTVDTLVAARNNPSLCDSSDYCAVNSHPFFDGNTAAEDSGSFLQAQIPTLQAVLANKNQEIVITETGWPWQGETNGKAVPSPANQASAISSIKSSFSSSPAAIILFTPYNDMWKTNSAAQFNAEQYWGFIGNSPSG